MQGPRSKVIDSRACVSLHTFLSPDLLLHIHLSRAAGRQAARCAKCWPHQRPPAMRAPPSCSCHLNCASSRTSNRPGPSLRPPRGRFNSSILSPRLLSSSSMAFMALAFRGTRPFRLQPSSFEASLATTSPQNLPANASKYATIYSHSWRQTLFSASQKITQAGASKTYRKCCTCKKDSRARMRLEKYLVPQRYRGRPLSTLLHCSRLPRRLE